MRLIQLENTFLQNCTLLLIPSAMLYVCTYTIYMYMYMQHKLTDIILGELWQPGPGVCSESEDAVQRTEFRAGTCT